MEHLGPLGLGQPVDQPEHVDREIAALHLQAAQPPVHAARPDQPGRGLRVARRDRAADGGVQVVLLGRQPPQPRKLPAAEQRVLARLRQPQEVSRMPTPDLLRLARLGQPLPPVGPDDLEHPVPRPVLGLPDNQQRLVHQRRQQVKHVLRRHQPPSATRSPSSAATGNPAQTCSAASSVPPPANTDSRRNSARSPSSSRSQLQSTTARSV